MLWKVFDEIFGPTFTLKVSWLKRMERRGMKEGKSGIELCDDMLLPHQEIRRVSFIVFYVFSHNMHALKF